MCTYYMNLNFILCYYTFYVLYSGSPRLSPASYGAFYYYINVKFNTFHHEAVNQVFAKYI